MLLLLNYSTILYVKVVLSFWSIQIIEVSIRSHVYIRECILKNYLKKWREPVLISATTFPLIHPYWHDPIKTVFSMSYWFLDSCIHYYHSCQDPRLRVHPPRIWSALLRLRYLNRKLLEIRSIWSNSGRCVKSWNLNDGGYKNSSWRFIFY